MHRALKEKDPRRSVPFAPDDLTGTVIASLHSTDHKSLSTNHSHSGLGVTFSLISDGTRSVSKGWLWRHESGTYVKFTSAGAELFA
jgi:hypothetical protein